MGATPDDLKPHVPAFACLAGCLVAGHIGYPVVANDFMVAAMAWEIVVLASQGRQDARDVAPGRAVPVEGISASDRRSGMVTLASPRFHSPVMERLRARGYPAALVSRLDDGPCLDVTEIAPYTSSTRRRFIPDPAA